MRAAEQGAQKIKLDLARGFDILALGRRRVMESFVDMSVCYLESINHVLFGMCPPRGHLKQGGLEYMEHTPSQRTDYGHTEWEEKPACSVVAELHLHE